MCTIRARKTSGTGPRTGSGPAPQPSLGPGAAVQRWSRSTCAALSRDLVGRGRWSTVLSTNEPPTIAALDRPSATGDRFLDHPDCHSCSVSRWLIRSPFGIAVEASNHFERLSEPLPSLRHGAKVVRFSLAILSRPEFLLTAAELLDWTHTTGLSPAPPPHCSLLDPLRIREVSGFACTVVRRAVEPW